MTQQKRKYRDSTRAARFLIIRDAVLAHSHRMQQIHAGMYEIGCGPFLIHYSIPGVWGPGRPFNLAIWLAGAQDGGHILQGNKVANVDWDQWDNVDILSFRSGEWEKELLNLLAGSENIGFLPRP